MKRLYVVASDSASGNLQEALRERGINEAVLSWLEDFSCGPIGSTDPKVRSEWWAPFHLGERTIEFHERFWNTVDATADCPTVWFSRHSASELAFFHAWVERLGSRSYDVVDVTGFRYEFVRPDGLVGISRPANSVGTIRTEGLRELFGSERTLTDEERHDAAERWRRLRAEDAPFRIVTTNGLSSVPSDCFDALLLAQAATDWQRMGRLVHFTMGSTWNPMSRWVTPCFEGGSRYWWQMGNCWSTEARPTA